MAVRVLILGGTADAVALARLLAGDARFDATVSLAGRTRTPALQALPTRVGGFGGVAGLIEYLKGGAIDAVVDATHPFAARISANARAACTQTGVPLAVLRRPPWTPGPGDDWLDAGDMDGAARMALACARDRGGCVFLTMGRQELAPFIALADALAADGAVVLPFLVRSVDPPDVLPHGAHLVLDRGPYTLEGELALMRAHDVRVLVTKNSGGSATVAKLDAARRLGVRVVMVARPAPGGDEAAFPVLADAARVMDWLAAHAAGSEEVGAVRSGEVERGV